MRDVTLSPSYATCVVSKLEASRKLLIRAHEPKKSFSPSSSQIFDTSSLPIFYHIEPSFHRLLIPNIHIRPFTYPCYPLSLSSIISARRFRNAGRFREELAEDAFADRRCLHIRFSNLGLLANRSVVVDICRPPPCPRSGYGRILSQYLNRCSPLQFSSHGNASYTSTMYCAGTRQYGGRRMGSVLACTHWYGSYAGLWFKIREQFR